MGFLLEILAKNAVKVKDSTWNKLQLLHRKRTEAILLPPPPFQTQKIPFSKSVQNLLWFRNFYFQSGSFAFVRMNYCDLSECSRGTEAFPAKGRKKAESSSASCFLLLLRRRHRWRLNQRRKRLNYPGWDSTKKYFLHTAKSHISCSDFFLFKKLVNRW